MTRAGFEQQVDALRKQFVADDITPEQKARVKALGCARGAAAPIADSIDIRNIAQLICF